MALVIKQQPYEVLKHTTSWFSATPYRSAGCLEVQLCQVRDVVTSLVVCQVVLLSCGCSQLDLLHFLGAFWSHGQTIIAGISQFA